MRQHRIAKLAERIDALSEKDELTLRRAAEVAELRRAAAVSVHRACQGFVERLNALLSTTRVVLDPGEFAAEQFREDGPNLFQIGVRGRYLQIEFRATGELSSTEEFRVPYTLEGSIRCFNQELLEQDLILEQMLFYCLEKGGGMWRYFDERTYRTGSFDEEYLAGLLEELV